MSRSTISAGLPLLWAWTSLSSLPPFPLQATHHRIPLVAVRAVTQMELDSFVRHFASGMAKADSLRPQAKSSRSGRTYGPGIGPFAEDRAVELTVAQMRALFPVVYDDLRCQVAYPGSRQKCDLVFADPPTWAVEVKMARFRRDNGKPDDTATKDLFSPFECDHSAVSDCAKLVASRIAPNCAVVIYGFDDPLRPLDIMADAFEALAQTRARLGSRCSAPLTELVHPVFRSGRVFAWRVSPR